jgi:hypothetical protein
MILLWLLNRGTKLIVDVPSNVAIATLA